MRSTEKGFTLLEMLIAMGLLTFVLSTFVVMIGVAGQIMADNRRELQRTYARLAVSEVVRSNPYRIIVYDAEHPETQPVIYNGFFPDSWPNGEGSRDIESITLAGTDILEYSKGPGMNWNVVIEHEQRNVYVSVVDVE